jgi:hypothetical protein
VIWVECPNILTAKDGQHRNTNSYTSAIHQPICLRCFRSFRMFHLFCIEQAGRKGLPLYSASRGQTVKELNVRESAAVHPSYLGICGFDEVVLIWGVGTVPVAQAEMAGWQA